MRSNENYRAAENSSGGRSRPEQKTVLEENKNPGFFDFYGFLGPGYSGDQ